MLNISINQTQYVAFVLFPMTLMKPNFCQRDNISHHSNNISSNNTVLPQQMKIKTK
jgi:hypothetical protein